MTITCGRLVIAAITLAVMASSANAQMMGGGAGGAGGGGGGGHKQHQQKADTAQHAPKADEKAYEAALKTIPTKKVDPWGGVR